MAEVVGVISGAIALADTTVRAGKGIMALKRLWNEVLEVPEYINSLLDRMALVHSVLSELEAELNRDQQLNTSGAVRLSVQHCRGAKNRLGTLVADLAQQVDDKKRFSRNKARVKAVFGKELAGRMEAEIRDAMQLVGIAQQTYALSLARQQPALIMAQVRSGDGLSGQSTQEAIKGPFNDTEKMTGRSQTQSGEPKAVIQDRLCLPWKYSKLGSYTSKHSLVNSHENASNEEVYSTRLQLPSWLTRSVWDICARQAHNGWTYSLQTWTVRPEESTIFDTIRGGDLSASITLFNNGKASLYDRDPDGWTLLHFAALNRDLETFKYLVRSGLTIHATNALGYSSLFYLYHSCTQLNQVLSLFEFLDSNEDLYDHIPEIFASHSFSHEAEELLRFLWRVPGLFDRVAGQFDLPPPESWFESINWWPVDPKVLLHILQRREIDTAAVRSQLLSSPYSLRRFVQIYFNLVPGGENEWNGGDPSIHSVLADWRRLAVWMFHGARPNDLSMQADLPEDGLMTLLFEGLTWSGWKIPSSRRVVRRALKRLQDALVFWLEDVLAAGVDLELYGWWERKRFNEGWGLQKPCWEILSCGGAGPQLASIMIGPQPQDWKLTWDWDADDSYVRDEVGRFFDWAERPPPLMPGSWQDEEE